MKTNKLITKTMTLMWILVISLALLEQGFAENTNQGVPIVKVMTQNVFIGADLDIILNEPNQAGVIKFLQAVQNTDFPERAEALADEIQRQQPDLIGLQEVALFGLIVPEVPPVAVAYLDYKEILLEALSARNLHYEVAVTANNTTVTFPFSVDIDNDGSADGIGIQFTDRDVILVHKKVSVSDVEAVIFKDKRVFSFPEIPEIPEIVISRGYAAINATVRGKTYRFVNTHLENEGDDPSIQDKQAIELIENLKDEELPIILVGDFNSGPSEKLLDPRKGSPYDQLIDIDAGYIDAWTERKGPRHHSNDPGYTCCQEKELLNTSELDKRIDLIWIRPVDCLPPDCRPRGVNDALARTTVEGDDPKEKTPSGLWPSDHAGVAAKMNIPSNVYGSMASGFKKAQRRLVGLKW